MAPDVLALQTANQELADAVANMTVVDAVYEQAGLHRRGEGEASLAQERDVAVPEL